MLKGNRIFSSPIDIILITGFFILNLALRILFINSREIAIDEPFSIFFSQQNINEIFEMLKTENNPPVHFLLLHFCIKLFGISAFSVRFLSVLFSALTTSIIFFTGKQFIGRFCGIVAALIFTFSNMHIYFSHEARVYPLFVLLAVLSLYSFLTILKNPQKKSAYIFLTIWNLLIIYSHYFGFFVLITEFICILFIRELKPARIKFFLIFAILALCYIPNIIIFFNRLSVSIGGTWVQEPLWSELYGNINRFINTKYNTLTLLILIFTSAILFIIKKQTNIPLKSIFKNKTQVVIMLWFAIPYLLMFAISFKVPMFLDRYILFTSVPLYLLIAILISQTSNNTKIKTVFAIIFVISMIITTNLNPDNNRRVTEVVKISNELKGENGIIVISPDYAYREYVYYYNFDYFRDYKNTVTLLNSDGIFPANDYSEIKNKLTNISSNIVYVDCGAEFAFGTDKILDSLSANYYMKGKYEVFEIYKIYNFTP